MTYQRNKGNECKIINCTEPARKMGLCIPHYNKSRRYPDDFGQELIGRNLARRKIEALREQREIEEEDY